jgi:hypothetical protein
LNFFELDPFYISNTTLNPSTMNVAKHTILSVLPITGRTWSCASLKNQGEATVGMRSPGLLNPDYLNPKECGIS